DLSRLWAAVLPDEVFPAGASRGWVGHVASPSTIQTDKRTRGARRGRGGLPAVHAPRPAAESAGHTAGPHAGRSLCFTAERSIRPFHADTRPLTSRRSRRSVA